jgi:hypothetical protein
MMNDLKNWLINRLPELIPCHISNVVSGTLELSFNFESLNDFVDPLSIKVSSRLPNKKSVDETFNFSVSGDEPELQFVKRLQYTPFFVSALSYENFTLYIVDFYEWTPVTTIYRIFYIPCSSGDYKFEVRLPSHHEQAGPNIFKIQNWYFTHIGSTTEKGVNSTLKITIPKDKTDDQVFICSFSEKQLSAGDLSPQSLLKKLDKAENEVVKYHIKNFIKIQDRKKQQLLDELWSRQKGLNPDRKINKTQSDEDILWTLELFRYMGWNELPDTKVVKKFQNMIKGPHKNNIMFYDAYFKNSYTDDEVINSLQSWWDQYSLPLYRIKLKRELYTNPSLIFVIYSLALQMQLPWSMDLYRLSNFFFHEPQIALLAYLFQIMMVRIGEENTIRVAPGPGFVGNVKYMKRGDSEYRYTRFGAVHFTSLHKKNVPLFKFNKEVIVHHDQTLNQITIKPHILPVDINHLRSNNISIRFKAKIYQIPLVWKKAELSLPGCRIRWIFKKDRFQLTCQPDKSSTPIKIDEKVINLSNSKKVKYYHPIRKSEITAVCKLLDISGRSYFLNQKNSGTSAQLIGWIQDRYGLLVDSLNIRISSHQIPYSEQESGIIKQSFNIPAKLDTIEILSKKLVREIPIRKIENRVYQKLMNYSPGESRSILLIILNDQLKIHKEEIQRLIFDHLGFIPLIIYKSEIKKKLNTDYILLIDEKDTLYTFENKTTFFNLSVLSISYPEGIRKLYQILSDQI